MKGILSVGRHALCVVDGEFVLRFYPNGGGVIALRAVWSAVFLFLAALAVYSFSDAGAGLEFSAPELRRLVHCKIEWFGAMLVATYVALYSRFSSQWSYLAGLYNQITQSRIESLTSADKSGAAMSEWAKPLGLTRKGEHYAIWMAAFVADAIEMHLARKPIFSACVTSMLEINGVEQAFLDASPGNRKELERFRDWVKQRG